MRFLTPAFCSFLLLTGACPADPDDIIDWQPAFAAEDTGWLLSTWGAEGERFAVGGSRQDDGIIMHFDGTEWSELETSLDIPLLNWVHGFSPRDVFMVGNDGRIFRYDGTALTEMTTPTTQQLWGIWGATSDDLYAVGGDFTPGNIPVLMHWDGAEWTDVALPPLERANVRAFFKVWGTSANDVIVVGQQGVILRYDGTGWQEFGAGTGADLISLWGTGPDRIVVVGGRGNGVMATWDGTEWRSQSLSPLPGLNGVWTRDGTTVHAVGEAGTVARIDFDTFEVEEDIVAAPHDFHAIFSDGNIMTAVGGNLAAGLNAPVYNGMAFDRALIPSD